MKGGNDKNDNCKEPTDKGGCCPRKNRTDPEASAGTRCALLNSNRFTLRVLEAMRFLKESNECPEPKTSTVKEIVEFVKEHFDYNGDVNAQVRTALRVVVCAGFVRKNSNNDYEFVGPFANGNLRRCQEPIKPCKRKRMSSSKQECPQEKKNSMCPPAKRRGKSESPCDEMNPKDPLLSADNSDEDSIYQNLMVNSPEEPTTHERDLKRWIRNCRKRSKSKTK